MTSGLNNIDILSRGLVLFIYLLINKLFVWQAPFYLFSANSFLFCFMYLFSVSFYLFFMHTFSVNFYLFIFMYIFCEFLFILYVFIFFEFFFIYFYVYIFCEFFSNATEIFFRFLQNWKGNDLSFFFIMN